MKRFLLAAILLVLAVGIAAPFLQADLFRPKIQRALERGLGRRVEVEEAHFNLFTGPGFTLSRVTIHEDPRAGIEPFAYMESLEARVRLLSLFSRRLEFSSLKLDDASVNLVKTDAGPWNFQFLLGGAAATAVRMPAINMRSGRVNFKFGDTKSVFYFNDADLDVSPADDGSVEVRFAGAPSRTDRSAQNFGHFFVRGNWRDQKLNMKVELERSAVEEVARLLDQRGFGVHGIVAFEALLSGPPSHLDIDGKLEVDDVHRWDLLPQKGGGLQIGYKGTLDLWGARLELATTSETPNPQLAMQFRAWDFLNKPAWDASADLNHVPIATLMEVARHMGATLPENMAADGWVSGSLRYSAPDGPAGRVELQEASFTLPDAKPLRTESAAVTIDRQAVSLESSTVHVGDDESAAIEASYNLAQDGGQEAGLDLKIATGGLSVADLQPFGLAAMPLIDQTAQGTWRGSVRYRWSPGGDGAWSGAYELQNARIAVDGLADPLRIQSAAVSLNGRWLSATRLRAKAGEIAFTGEYRWEPGTAHPHKFNIAVPEANAAELERLLTPALMRERGFLARTLRLGSAPLPDWLKTRRADGTFSIESLKVGDAKIRFGTARLLWDGSTIKLAHVKADLDPTTFNGEILIDLAAAAPHYRVEGRLQDVAYAGGQIDFEGSLDTDGTGVELLANARAEGRLHGRSIAFASDADFRTAASCFEMQSGLAGPRWKFTGLEVSQGGDTYYGTGSTQADGKLMLELANRGRLFRYTSALLSPAP